MKNCFIDAKELPKLYIYGGSEYKAMIHVDPGHGGEINGVYQTQGKSWDFGDFKVLEGVQNRAIAKLFAKKLYSNGISYNFTTISNYDESLKDRMLYVKNITKAYPSFTHVFISIHADASAEHKARGITFFTTPGITDSDYAANLYFPYLYDLGLNVRTNRAIPQEYDKEENFYVIRKAEEYGCVAMLYEFGFFDNRDEALVIIQPEFHESAATALYKGTVDLLNKIKQNGSVR